MILTFNSPTLLTRIKAPYLSCPIRPYIPNHFIVFSASFMAMEKSIPEISHKNKNCENAEYCVSCQCNHTAHTRSFPNCILEKENNS